MHKPLTSNINIKAIIIGIIALCIMSYTTKAYADSSLISLYNSFVEGLPSMQSYSLKAQALKFDNEGLSRSRFFNPTITTLYSSYQNPLMAPFPVADISISNDFDIFNKLGIDVNKNKLDLETNKVLINLEKRNIFISLLEAYSSLVKNKYLLTTNEKNLEALEKHIQIIKNGIKEGKFSEDELAKWDIIKLNHINDIEGYKLEIFKAEVVLKSHSKQEQIVTDEIDINKLKQQEYPEISEENFIKNAPEIAALKISRKQLELDIKKINMSVLPSLQVSNVLEYNNDPTSFGNRNITVAAMNFVLPNGTGKPRIKSLEHKIKGLEQEKEAQIVLLKNTFKIKMKELNFQRFILINLENEKNISEKNLDKLRLDYQKKILTHEALVSAIKENELIKENYVIALATLNQTYEYLYHLSKGDIF